MTSSIYRGTVMHARHDRVAKRSFRYHVYVAALDLDELADPSSALRTLRLLSYNRRNLFSIDDRDYANAARGLRIAHDETLARHTIARPDRVTLVTNPRVLGYTFNPVSFFLGYTGKRLTSVIAEVNNTYGGRHQYVLGPEQRISEDGFRASREFFVSPFLHGPMSYDFYFRGDLAIVMSVHDRDTNDRVFTARFDGSPRPLTDRTLLGVALRYPLMTAQVIGLIYFEAMIMHARGAPYRRPGPDHRPSSTK